MEDQARVSQLEFGKGSKLWEYWTKGGGFAKWASALHKWSTLHRLLLKEGVPEHEAKGLTTNIIEAVMPGYMAQAHAKGHRNMATSVVTRSFPLEDISIRSGGDGRTVEAYAAVFDVPSEINDRDGHYNEVISRSAFDRTIAARSDRLPVFYNHGMTLFGTPSDLASVPIGRSVEMRADNRGLYTVARYNPDPFSDRILESIKNGDITGQSFTGRMVQSKPERGPYRRTRSGDLTTVTRNEIQLREFGPTPFPAYPEAGIVGVRALLEQAYRLGGMDLGGDPAMWDPDGDGIPGEPGEGTPEEEAMDAELMKLLAGLSDGERMHLAEMAETMHADGSARARLGWDALVAELRAKGASDPEGLARYIGRRKYGRKGFAALQAAGRKAHGRSEDLTAALRHGEPPQRTDTPEAGAVTAEPEPETGHHSGPVMTRTQMRARLFEGGFPWGKTSSE